MFDAFGSNNCSKNLQLEQYDLTTTAYVPFVNTVTDQVKLAANGNNWDLTTMTNVSLDNSGDPIIVTARIDDRKDAITRKNFTVLVCGSETVNVTPESQEFIFQYNTNNTENITQNEILNFKAWFSSSQTLCPVTEYILEHDHDETVTPTLVLGEDVVLDATNDQVNVSNAQSGIKDFKIIAKTGSNVTSSKSVKVNICGRESVIAKSEELLVFNFNVLANQTQNLISLSNLTALTDWFINSDPLCGWKNFSYKAIDTETEQEVAFPDAITLGADYQDITVKTDAMMDTTIVLNVSTVGYSTAIKKIRVIICGNENVTFNGTSFADLTYDEESTFTFPASTFLDGFASSTQSCPITKYAFAKTKEAGLLGQRLPDIDGAVTIGPVTNPEITFDFAAMFTNFEKNVEIWVYACSAADRCANFTLDLTKITCADGDLTLSEGASITREIKGTDVAVIQKSDYENSFINSNPKCAVTKWGISTTVGGLVFYNLDGQIDITREGEVTFVNELIIAQGLTERVFYIVGEVESGS